MSLTWTYSHPTTPAGAGTAIAITSAVQVKAEHRLTAAASVGDASVVGIMVEDEGAAYDFKGLWRVYVIEGACDSADHYAWNGYVGKQKISRGSGTDVMYPVTTGRRWELELSELSSLAGFRVISGSDGNRAAETVNARVAWLIGTATAYLPAFDNGLIASDTTALDANDYRGQYANDVLNDMAVQIGFNWWIYYDQSATDEEVSLAFFDPDSSLYTSDIKISNVAADIDGTAVFAPYEDGDVERDPQKIAAGVYLPYSGSAVYEYHYSTSYTYAFRDQVAPTASIKTSAKATALAQRFLSENNDQDERANLTIRLPAAQLNDVKHGHRMQVKLQHVPGWENYRWCRVIRKTFAPPANRSQSYYDVDLELAPITVPSSWLLSFGFEGGVNAGLGGLTVTDFTSGTFLTSASDWTLIEDTISASPAWGIYTFALAVPDATQWHQWELGGHSSLVQAHSYQVTSTSSSLPVLLSAIQAHASSVTVGDAAVVIPAAGVVFIAIYLYHADSSDYALTPHDGDVATLIPRHNDDDRGRYFLFTYTASGATTVDLAFEASGTPATFFDWLWHYQAIFVPAGSLDIIQSTSGSSGSPGAGIDLTWPSTP